MSYITDRLFKIKVMNTLILKAFQKTSFYMRFALPLFIKLKFSQLQPCIVSLTCSGEVIVQVLASRYGFAGQ